MLMRQGKASLCGHFEAVQFLLEAGALCERDTFQGERCLYNALNDKIRKLLLEYDYSKSSDPLQPLAAHITSLLARDQPQTSDIVVTADNESFRLHKFLLSARSPYFSKKLAATPDSTIWKLPSSLPPQSFDISIRYLYFGEIPNDVGGGPGTGFTEDQVLEGLDKISKHLEIRSLWDGILESGDRRLARQRRTDEVEKGRDQIESWFNDNVIRHKLVTDTDKADDVKWDRDNAIFADILLRADDAEDADFTNSGELVPTTRSNLGPLNGIPIGPSSKTSRSPSRSRTPRRSVLFPCHRAMLLRSELFNTMFSSHFREAQSADHLHIVPVDCTPAVLEVVLRFLYTEKTEVPLELALDTLYAADLLFIDKLKMRAAVVISTLGSGNVSQIPSRLDAAETSATDRKEEELDIYEIIRAAWLLHVTRLEEFGARYIALRLESFIDEPEFEEIVKESAGRIQGRQETDTIELLDDIRYYLSERFRLRFEDAGIEEMLEEEVETEEDQQMDKVWPDQRLSSTDDGAEAESMDNGVPKVNASDATIAGAIQTGKIRTLDGEEVEDELEEEAMNYQILLGKIDRLLEKLKLDA